MWHEYGIPGTPTTIVVSGYTHYTFDFTIKIKQILFHALKQYIEMQITLIDSVITVPVIFFPLGLNFTLQNTNNNFSNKDWAIT